MKARFGTIKTLFVLCSLGLFSTCYANMAMCRLADSTIYSIRIYVPASKNLALSKIWEKEAVNTSFVSAVCAAMSQEYQHDAGMAFLPFQMN